MHRSLLFSAWKKLMLAFLISFGGSMVAGTALLYLIDISPEALFELSTKRLSYAIPVMDMGAEAGVDPGILLFIWNSLGALATLSFIYTAALFNPLKVSQSPQRIRKLFCGSGRMKLLCFLPGCMKIELEQLRRLYVWLMVPLIGMILLGIETGFSASTAKLIFGSYRDGLLPLLLHGIIEIPAFALAGAITFSGHLLIKPKASGNRVGQLFQDLELHKKALPIKAVAVSVILALLIAGMVEAHVTQALFDQLS